MQQIRRKLATLSTAVVLCLLLASCSNSDSDEQSLTLYNAQHEDLMQLMIDGFTKESGIKVNMRNGSDFELANQILQEGSASPADVFVTENSPAMVSVQTKDGFTEIDAATLQQVPGQYVPSDKKWVGFAARSTVFVHNKNNVPAGELPQSILDLSQPKWKDKIGIAPAGADFQAIVSAVLSTKGEAVTTEWLNGLKQNARVYQGNIPVLKAANAGEISGGINYHYYWHKDQAESGINSSNAALHYFGNQDPGAFVSISGAGVVKASKKQQQAQQLVKYLTGISGQRILADSKALEYTVNSSVPSNPRLKPLSELNAPTVDPATLNGPRVVELMQKAGLL